MLKDGVKKELGITTEDDSEESEDISEERDFYFPSMSRPSILTKYTYNQDNQLILEEKGLEWKNRFIPLSKTEYTYDQNGNQLKKKVIKGQARLETTTYDYDYENRLTKITYPDGSISQYTYDGVGKRIKATETETTVYLYDGLNAIIERNKNGKTIASYIRGLSYGGGIGSIISSTRPRLFGKDIPMGWEEIEECEKSGDKTFTTYYHYDGLGSVTNLTSSKGHNVAGYEYDAYGNILKQTGLAKVNPYRFSTKEFSPQSGLVYFGARYYDPKLGRWITKDLIPALNLYVYCKNNPINLIDPFGLDTYYINRTFEKDGRSEPTNSSYSHSYVAITDNGRVTDTYSWGNGWQSKWFHNDPVDMAAAQKAIDSGVGSDWEGGEDLDHFIVIKFEKRKNETDPYIPGLNDCKKKATSLIKDAMQQKKKKEKLK